MTRTERWSAQLLNSRDQVVRDLPGVVGGGLAWSIFKAVPGSGDLTFSEPVELDVSWLTARIRIRHHVGDDTTDCGIWLPVIPAWEHDWPRRTAQVTLTDKVELLNRSPGRWVSAFDADMPPTTWVEQQILAVTGERAAIESSAASWPAPQVFDPLEWTWLGVLNAVLASIGYTSLSASLEGVITASRYLGPDERTPVGTYGGQAGDLRMRRQFKDEAGIWDVPNVVVVIVPATDSTPMLRGEARNDDPLSPLSTVNSGERVHVEEGEASDQTGVDALAARRLQERSQITRRVTWQHPMDHTRMDDVIHFRPLGGERLAIVQRSVELGVGAVVQTTGRRIYTGGDSPWQ